MKYSIQDLISKFQNNTLDIPNGNYTTTNEQGNNVIVYIQDNELHFVTLQANNYIRHTVYYKDGTKEEYYDN